MDEVVRYVVYPCPGIARVVNSPDEYFTGPEAPGELPEPEGGSKDAAGRIKRQAARSRVYGLNRRARPARPAQVRGGVGGRGRRGGRREALLDYARLIDGAFAQYLVMRHDRYLAERRWPDSTFWRRRHAPADA